MIRKKLLIVILIAGSLFFFAGCNNMSQEKTSDIGIVTDNEINVNMLASNMTQFEGNDEKLNKSDSLTTKVSKSNIDFSSLTYSDDTVKVGDVVYVEGVIPRIDYPSDRVHIYLDPENNVRIENGVLTNKDEDTVLTFDVVGEEPGSATVYVELDDSEITHYFDVQVTEDAYTRSMPNSYTVYCTPTGSKYHSAGCSYLRGNGIGISLDEALSKGLGACSRCHP